MAVRHRARHPPLATALRDEDFAPRWSGSHQPATFVGGKPRPNRDGLVVYRGKEVLT